MWPFWLIAPGLKWDTEALNMVSVSDTVLFSCVWYQQPKFEGCCAQNLTVTPLVCANGKAVAAALPAGFVPAPALCGGEYWLYLRKAAFCIDLNLAAGLYHKVTKSGFNCSFMVYYRQRPKTASSPSVCIFLWHFLLFISLYTHMPILASGMWVLWGQETCLIVLCLLSSA